jgi:dethiobiotin synthetase
VKRGVVVVGSHTDVGKTFCACALVRRLVEQGVAVAPRKPVLSGVEEDDASLAASDIGQLLLAAGRAVDRPAIHEVAPLRFRRPWAPDAAARAEGRTLRLSDVLAAAAAPGERFVVVETAGGIMSPVAEDGLVIDVAAALALPCVLVVGAYLGGISHGLSAYAVLAARRLEVAAVIVNRADGVPVIDADMEPFERFLPGVAVTATSSPDWVEATLARLRV